MDERRIERNEAQPPLLLRVRDGATRLAISERYLHQLIANGKCSTVALGRAKRIPMGEIERLAREGV